MFKKPFFNRFLNAKNISVYLLHLLSNNYWKNNNIQPKLYGEIGQQTAMRPLTYEKEVASKQPNKKREKHSFLKA